MAYIYEIRYWKWRRKMYTRLAQLPKNYSFFLFGARGTGKSTILKNSFALEAAYWIDLLDPETELRFFQHPSLLRSLVEALPATITHIVIDEVQKVPQLLDVVHGLIESTSKIFLLTGSSARKLKRGGANLLAGRAFVTHLYPLSFLELGTDFDLWSVLHFGQLPKVQALSEEKQKAQFLTAYTDTYLKEEIIAEQVVRNLAPFRRFLEVAAQSQGKVVNYANISRDVGSSEALVKEYFSILEDTLVGFLLEPFVHSFRKRLSHKPKFYFFDTGVVRALARQLNVPLEPRTTAYGDAFKHLVLAETMRLCAYFHSDYRCSYLRTKDDAEIDLIVERPGKPLLCIEIKSTVRVLEADLRSFLSLTRDLPGCKALCLSNDPLPQKIEHATALHWMDGLRQHFTL